MSDAELIARLRDAKRDWPEFGHDRAEAADRIEELAKERDQWISHAKAAIWSDSEELKETERKLAKAAEVLEQCEIMLRLRGHDEVAAKARNTIAEIKGESHE